jgi:hypothetical protein
MAPSAFLLLLLVFTGFATTATAQEEAFSRSSRETGNGHWKLFTDADSRSTTITFYDPQERPVYEEVLPGRYVKLTSRNVAILDKACQQICRQTLLLSKVASADLQEAIWNKRAGASTQQVRTGEADLKEESGSAVKVNFFPLRTSGKFQLLFENPARKRLIVKLENEDGRVIHSESVIRSGYMRNFDLSGSYSGKYILSVTSPDRTVRYQANILLGPAQRVVEVQPQLPAFVAGN